jgi:rhomboid protease GluP
VLPPFLTVVIGTTLSMVAIRWLLCINSLVFEVKEEFWTFWVPIVLPWIPILIWLRPSLKMLEFKKDSLSGRFLLLFIAWGVLTALLFFSQAYLSTATGKLSEINKPSDIEKYEKVRYYRINSFYVAPFYGGTYTNFRRSGKGGKKLNFEVFFVKPMLDIKTNRLEGAHKYWYGLKFQKQICNNIESKEKERLYQEFYKECVLKMNKHAFYSLDYFERKTNSNDLPNYLNAIVCRTNQRGVDYVVLLPKTESYANKNGNKLEWLFGSFGIGLVVFLLYLILPDFIKTDGSFRPSTE